MNVLLIGCGGIGAIHAEKIVSGGMTLAAVADTDAARVTAIARKYGATAYTDAEKAMRHPGLDAVGIATPTTTHLKLVEAAARAGKNIFCEKPLAGSLAECEKIVKAADKMGVKLFVGHVVRYFQEFDTIRDQIKKGAIGKPGFIRTFRGGIIPSGWFRDYKLSGGVTLDCCIHDFDWIRYAFGDVTRVFSQHLQRTTPTPMDYSMTTLRLKSGMLAQVTGSWAHPSGFRVKVEVCGDAGMIQYDSGEAPINTNVRQTSAGAPTMIVPASPVPVSPYQLEWEDFAAWCTTGRKPRVTAQDAVEAVRIGLAALESAKSGKPVRLN
jgi:UDP-N-acetylglucosamine 3-dehydrogenase